MLIEEVERLRAEQLHAREQVSHLTRVASAEAEQKAEDGVASTLHGRVQRTLNRSSDESKPTSVEEAGSAMGADRPRTSAQAWIEALRRQG
jgi:hypothetical protein